MKKRVNVPLIIGLVIIVLLIGVMVFESSLKTSDTDTMRRGNFEWVNGEMVFYDAPGPPDSEFIMGTDVIGRDIYSRLIAGTKLTLGMAALTVLFRFLIGFPIGIAAGFNNRFCMWLTKTFSTIFSAIPALLFSIVILSRYELHYLTLGRSILAFAIVMTFVGWNRIAKITQEQTRNVLTQDFIEGEIAIGKGRIMMIIQNVLPHIMPVVITAVTMEFARALMLLAELGLFGVYAGPTVLSGEDMAMLGLTGATPPSNYPEWGGILAAGRYGMIVKKYWLIIWPTMMFFVSILGFNLLGEGLSLHINRRRVRG